MPAEEKGPAAAATGPSAEPAPVRPPSPMEAELAGLGTIVAIMRQLSPLERQQVVDFLSDRYEDRVDVQALAAVPEYTPRDVNDLTIEILRARRRGLEFGSLMMATMILDAGYRKAE